MFLTKFSRQCFSDELDTLINKRRIKASTYFSQLDNRSLQPCRLLSQLLRYLGLKTKTMNQIPEVLSNKNKTLNGAIVYFAGDFSALILSGT
jgi:hypothetical protein